MRNIETKYPFLFRKDHPGNTPEGIMENDRREERRSANWERAQKLWGTASATMMLAFVFAIIFMAAIIANAVSDLVKGAFHISDVIIATSVITMLVFAIAGTVQIILALILERR